MKVQQLQNAVEAFDFDIFEDEHIPELHNVMFTTMEPDTAAKQIRRQILNELLRKNFVLLKYPLLTNPKPEWDVNYISVERKGVRA